MIVLQHVAENIIGDADSMLDSYQHKGITFPDHVVGFRFGFFFHGAPDWDQ